MSTEVAQTEAPYTLRVAAEIRAQMGRLNLNRTEVARRLEVENSWIGKRLNGQTEIGVTDLYRIAKALQVDVVDLMPGDTKGPLTTRSYAPRPIGASPLPTHPIVQAAIRLPAAGSADGYLARRTAPTGR